MTPCRSLITGLTFVARGQHGLGLLGWRAGGARA